jgi:hypothetical protein|mmetsp:Transcript_11416/g.12339  ORF Transcript_11416/g.12339 Transcript_11416/m.12339 type:complete len:86 (+) Transcript_11416:272-529(+)
MSGLELGVPASDSASLFGVVVKELTAGDETTSGIAVGGRGTDLGGGGGGGVGARGGVVGAEIDIAGGGGGGDFNSEAGVVVGGLS